MTDVMQRPFTEDIKQQAHRIAADKFRREPDWVTFYREVLGVDGVIAQLFPTTEAKAQFENTEEYAEIQRMLAKLRERNRLQKDCDESTRVITVRLPQSLHEALRHEAHNHKTSMNKLCISKLLQVVAPDLVPMDFERREPETAAESLAELRPPRVEIPAPAGVFAPRPVVSPPAPSVMAGSPSSASIMPTMPNGRPF